MNKVTLEELPGHASHAGGFIINSVVTKGDQRPKKSYFCRPRNEENRRLWLDSLNGILESQLNFGGALENPVAYLRELRDPAQ